MFLKSSCQKTSKAVFLFLFKKNCLPYSDQVTRCFSGIINWKPCDELNKFLKPVFTRFHSQECQSSKLKKKSQISFCKIWKNKQ